MSRPRPVPAKSQPAPRVPEFAEQPLPQLAVGARMAVAHSVPSGSDPHPADHLHPLLTQGEAA